MKSFNEWLQIRENSQDDSNTPKQRFLGVGRTTKKPPKTPETPKPQQRFLGVGRTTKKPKD